MEPLPSIGGCNREVTYIRSAACSDFTVLDL